MSAGQNQHMGSFPPVCASVTEPIFETSAMKAEHHNQELRVLCGQMIATLRTNLLRQTIKTADDNQFEYLLDAWSERLRRLQ